LSSGQQPQNPLLLLGQYSDDEGDAGSSKGLNDANVQSPMLNEEVFYYLHLHSKSKLWFCHTKYVSELHICGWPCMVLKLIFLIC